MPAPDADSDAADGRRTETSQPANVTAALLLRCAAAVVVALLQRDEGNDKELFCLPDVMILVMVHGRRRSRLTAKTAHYIFTQFCQESDYSTNSTILNPIHSTFTVQRTVARVCCNKSKE